MIWSEMEPAEWVGEARSGRGTQHKQALGVCAVSTQADRTPRQMHKPAACATRRGTTYADQQATGRRNDGGGVRSGAAGVRATCSWEEQQNSNNESAMQGGGAQLDAAAPEWRSDVYAWALCL